MMSNGQKTSDKCCQQLFLSSLTEVKTWKNFGPLSCPVPWHEIFLPLWYHFLWPVQCQKKLTDLVTLAKVIHMGEIFWGLAPICLDATPPGLALCAAEALDPIERGMLGKEIEMGRSRRRWGRRGSSSEGTGRPGRGSSEVARAHLVGG